MNYLKAIQEKQIEIDALINELDEVERLKSEAETAYVNKTMIDGADTTVELAKSEALMSKAIELCGAINAMRNEQEALIRESIDEGNRAPEPLTDKDIRDVESQLCILAQCERKNAVKRRVKDAIHDIIFAFNCAAYMSESADERNMWLRYMAAAKELDEELKIVQ